MTKPRIVMSVVDQHRNQFFTEAALNRLKEIGDFRLDPDPGNHASPESRETLSEAEIVITGWETGNLNDLLDDMPNLKLISHSAGTVRRIFGPEVFDHGVRVSAQTELNAAPVAEFTLAMMILGSKDIFQSSRRYHELRDKPKTFWDEFPHIGFYGCTIGIIGLSRISRRVIDLLKPFNVNIKVSSGHLSDEEAERLEVTPASQEEILSTCDVISLHTASTPKTYHMLKAKHFALIKDGAVFINTARGAICDQDALIEELKKDRFRAIIDVTDPEINVPDSPLWTLPNVFLTPHAAGSMGRELYRLGDGVIDDIENYLADQPIAGEFTRDDYAGRA